MKAINNIAELVASIKIGALDAEMDAIANAVSIRRDAIKRIKDINLRAALAEGDTVWFGMTVNPAYLRGQKAIVRKFNPKKIVVDLPAPIGRFSKGIICPPSILCTEKPA